MHLLVDNKVFSYCCGYQWSQFMLTRNTLIQIITCTFFVTVFYSDGVLPCRNQFILRPRLDELSTVPSNGSYSNIFGWYSTVHSSPWLRSSLRQTLHLNSMVEEPRGKHQFTLDDAPLRLKWKTSLTQCRGFWATPYAEVATTVVSPFHTPSNCYAESVGIIG